MATGRSNQPPQQPMNRSIRYQGAIICDDISCSSDIASTQPGAATGSFLWWARIARNRRGMHPERNARRTQLEVTVERLLLEDDDIPMGVYQRLKTYLCKMLTEILDPATSQK